MNHSKMLLFAVLFVSTVLSKLLFAEFSPTYAIVDCTIVPVVGDQVENGVIIRYVFINGEETDLSSVYTELLEKYSERNR